MTNNYLEMVKADVAEWLNDNEYYFNIEDYAGDANGFEEYLNDTLLIDDGVTGNASGSYTFNTYEAMEIVTANMPEVMEALTGFCYEADAIGKMFTDEEYEKLDVITRCYFLGQAIREVMEEQDLFDLIDNMEFEEETDETAAEIVTAEEIREETKTA